jgi:hypothetical protein
MWEIFTVLVGLMFLYFVYEAVVKGKVANGGYSPADESSRYVWREEKPVEFWILTVIYLGLGIWLIVSVM